MVIVRRKRLWGTVVVLMLGVAMRVHPEAVSHRPDSPDELWLFLQKGQTLAVIGVSREESQLSRAERKALKNQRIGFGLNRLLAQQLFDTGNFRLLEEKDVHKRELLESLVQTYWIEPGATYTEPVLHRVAIQLGVNLLAYGRVSHSVTSSGRISLGPFSRTTQTLRVGVDVCLYEAATHAQHCRQGQGKSQQKGVGVLYEFRNDQIAFEHSAAGIATQEAITKAVQALIKSVRWRP